MSLDVHGLELEIEGSVFPGRVWKEFPHWIEAFGIHNERIEHRWHLELDCFSHLGFDD